MKIYFNISLDSALNPDNIVNGIKFLLLQNDLGIRIVK